MKLYENTIWQADLDKCLEQLPDLDTLKGKSVLVTGATGLICSAVIHILIRYNDNLRASGSASDKISVYAACIFPRDRIYLKCVRGTYLLTHLPPTQFK